MRHVRGLNQTHPYGILGPPGMDEGLPESPLKVRFGWGNYQLPPNQPLPPQHTRSPQPPNTRPPHNQPCLSFVLNMFPLTFLTVNHPSPPTNTSPTTLPQGLFLSWLDLAGQAARQQMLGKNASEEVQLGAIAPTIMRIVDIRIRRFMSNHFYWSQLFIFSSPWKRLGSCKTFL